MQASYSQVTWRRELQRRLEAESGTACRCRNMRVMSEDALQQAWSSNILEDLGGAQASAPVVVISFEIGLLRGSVSRCGSISSISGRTITLRGGPVMSLLELARDVQSRGADPSRCSPHHDRRVKPRAFGTEPRRRRCSSLRVGSKVPDLPQISRAS